MKNETALENDSEKIRRLTERVNQLENIMREILPNIRILIDVQEDSIPKGTTGASLPRSARPNYESIHQTVAGLQTALKSERERCAKIADTFASSETDEDLVSGITTNGITAQQIAAAIRSDKLI